MLEGIDVSRWQPPSKLDYPAIQEVGKKTVAIRFAVGDYYTDAEAATHWTKFGEIGLYRTPYFVVAPADSAGRPITVAGHMGRFLSSFGDRESELPWVLDCELSRGMSDDYITALIGELVISFTGELGRRPIIYTRQSWWDTYVNASPLWAECPLWAARYAYWLPGPWADGKYTFRDWDEWVFWQYTSHGRLPNYSGDVDLNRFNGDEGDLARFSSNLTESEMLKILWREAGIHNWDLTP